MHVRLLHFIGMLILGSSVHGQNHLPIDLCQNIQTFRSLIGPESTNVGDICTSGAANRTVISLTEDTILHWNDFRVPQQHTLEFRFSSEAGSALNQVDSTQRSQVAGRIESNGRVAIIDANRGFEVTSTGQINARELFLSSLELTDPEAGSKALLRSEGQATFTKAATVGGFVSGQIQTAGGDTIIVSDTLILDQGSSIRAANSIRLLVGEEAVVDLTNDQQEVLAFSGRTRGTISNNGELAAGLVHRQGVLEVKAPAGIDNQPRGSMTVDPSHGHMVLEVAPSRFIRNSGRIEGGRERIVIRGILDGALPVDPSEGDNPSALIPAIKEIPIVARPNKAHITSNTQTKPASVIAVEMGSMSASAGGASKRPQTNKIASVHQYSFFGYRGSRANKKASSGQKRAKKKTRE